MALGDDKHQLIFEELVNVLGEEYVEDDPAVLEAFSRESQTEMYLTRSRCEFIVLPGSTEDIQAILRLANRHQFPCSVTSTGLLLLSCFPVKGYDYWCLIDPKRLNHFYIDEKNMCAVVEPYVTVAQVQAEAMKIGLFTGVTGAGAQGSALATSLNANSHWTGWRTSKGRNLLGVEWVLPTGDIFQTGTLTVSDDDYSWGDGPGISALGLLRGNRGPSGTLGVITRAAIKLYPWPGPAVWPTNGVQPEKVSVLPRDKFRTYIFNFPTMESCIEAVRELGEAEIGGVVMQVNPYEMVCLAARSREEFWARWHTEYWQKQIHHGHMLFITLWGFASSKQVDYEEAVLMDIAADTGGELIPENESAWVSDEVQVAAVRDSNRPRYLRLAVTNAISGSVDSLYDALRSIPPGIEVLAKYSPPLGDGGLYDRGQKQHKFWLADFGRIATVGIGSFGEKTEECEAVMAKVRPEMSRYCLDNKVFSVGFASEASRNGAHFANIHLLLASIKRSLDPMNIANPSRLVDITKVPETSITGQD